MGSQRHHEIEPGGPSADHLAEDADHHRQRAASSSRRGSKPEHALFSYNPAGVPASMISLTFSSERIMTVHPFTCGDFCLTYNKFFLLPGRSGKVFLSIKNLHGPPARTITIKYFRAFGQSVLFGMLSFFHLSTMVFIYSSVDNFVKSKFSPPLAEGSYTFSLLWRGGD